MNSLQELNNFGNATIEFTDNRPAQIVFDTILPINQTVLYEEGEVYTFPVGISIVEVTKPELTTMTYTIDVGPPFLATITWTSVPAGVTTSNPSPGVYVVSNMKTLADWNTIKDNTKLNLQNDITGSFELTAAFTSNLGDNKEWTVSATINEQLWFAPIVDYTYNQGAVNTGFAPAFLSLKPYTFTVTVTPDNLDVVVDLNSTSTQGSKGFNGTTKVLTLIGTASEMADLIDKLYIEIHPDIDPDFTLTYFVSDNTTAATDVRIQDLNAPNNDLIGSILSTISYDEDQPFSFYAPLVGSISTNGKPNLILTYTVETLTPGEIKNSTVFPSASNPAVAVNPSTHFATIVGTKTEINSYLTAHQFTFQPAADRETDITVKYTLDAPYDGYTAKSQKAYIVSTHPEAVNYNIDRTYDTYTVNFLFASNTPQVTDTEPGATYTIELTATHGYFDVDNDFGQVLTISGSKTSVNNALLAVEYFAVIPSGLGDEFVGDPDFFEEPDTINYKQYKNGVLQLDSNFGLTFNTSGTYEKFHYFYSNSTWTPSLADRQFGQAMDVLVVGGGGGASYRAGGGGGRVKEIINVNFYADYRNRTNVPIQIGAGGAAGSLPGAFGWINNHNLPGGTGGTSYFDVYTAANSAGGGTGGIALYIDYNSPLNDYTQGIGGDSDFAGEGWNVSVNGFAHGGGTGGGAGQTGTLGGDGYLSTIFYNQGTGDNYWAGGGAGENAGYGTSSAAGGLGGGAGRTSPTASKNGITGGGGAWGYYYDNALPPTYVQSPGTGGKGVIVIRVR